jgi:hypothetical protein
VALEDDLAVALEPGVLVEIAVEAVPVELVGPTRDDDVIARLPELLEVGIDFVALLQAFVA